MTDEKILEVISLYERELPKIKVDAYNFRHIPHILEMLPQMREFVAEGRREKLMRWLGYIQGVLDVLGVYTLNELKLHNAPDDV